MVIEGYIKDQLERQEKDDKAKKASELEALIFIGEEAKRLKAFPAWIRLKNEIDSRTISLTRRLVTANTDKEMFRLQGELLGLRSIENIIENDISSALEAKKILEGENL